MEVTCCVVVRRRVATADVAASHAKTQVDPIAANAEAVFTTVCAGCHRFDLIEV
jgi:mono/diheme cytochrome c family protein